MFGPEVVEYPDSEKVFVMTNKAPGGDKKRRNVSLVFKKSDATSYWTDEPEGPQAFSTTRTSSGTSSRSINQLIVSSSIRSNGR